MINNQLHEASVKGKTVVLRNKKADVPPITIRFKTDEEVSHFLDVIFNKD